MSRVAKAQSIAGIPASLHIRDIDFNLDMERVAPSHTVAFNTKPEKQKSYWLAVSYALIPGYFIPAAFGHAYAEAHAQAAMISTARLAGRILWMYTFFDNIWVQGADRSLNGKEMFSMYLGLTIDLAGYLYDILHSPIEVANFNKRDAQYRRQAKIKPFIDIYGDGPCCGVVMKF